MRLTDDGRPVVYSGDDERFDYFYKFIGSKRMKKGSSRAVREHNLSLLDEGTLYVAKLTGDSPAIEIDGTGKLPADGEFDGSGEWIPLATAGADGAVSHVEGMTADEVFVFTRLAGDKVGATKMDRPEDVEPNPVNGRVYVNLTNNSKRKADQVDGPNPRAENEHGQVLEATSISAGLDYPGVGPEHAMLAAQGRAEYYAATDEWALEGFQLLSATEGIVPAPESSHAIRAVIDEALECKKNKEPRVLLFNLSGHGHFDMAAYDQYFRGELEDFDYPAEAIAASLERLPKVASG